MSTHTMDDEGKYTSCTEVLDDWFNGANIQGVATMETAELVEMLECMRAIESANE